MEISGNIHDPADLNPDTFLPELINPLAPEFPFKF